MAREQAVREIHRIGAPDLAAEWVAELAATLDDRTYSPEIRRLGRTLKRWGPQTAAWHRSRASKGPVEAIIIGITNWTHTKSRRCPKVDSTFTLACPMISTHGRNS